jgi:beta-aspartyl-peptidase (threonine type)
LGGIKIKKNMKPTLIIHGGANFGPVDYDKNRDAEYKEALKLSLTKGYEVLNKKGSALDAVETAIHVLEECGLFDAGRGAVYTSNGIQELDASIMDGSNLKAGAVAGVHTIKRPISAARKVMEETWHVLLIGEGAEEFSKNQGLEIVPRSYFHNEVRYKQYLRLKAKEVGVEAKKHSTVGAVALDIFGNLAAGTSTGGLEMKMPGRVGDSPIIGAATYANNETCAVSCTGEGEFYIRTSAAFHISALMEYKNKTVVEASAEVLSKINKLGGEGGLIALDKEGNYAMPYSTESMFRGVVSENEFNVGV